MLLDEQIHSVMAQLQKETLSTPIGYSRNSEKACDSLLLLLQRCSEMLRLKLLAGKFHDERVTFSLIRKLPLVRSFSLILPKRW